MTPGYDGTPDTVIAEYHSECPLRGRAGVYRNTYITVFEFDGERIALYRGVPQPDTDDGTVQAAARNAPHRPDARPPPRRRADDPLTPGQLRCTAAAEEVGRVGAAGGQNQPRVSLPRNPPTTAGRRSARARYPIERSSSRADGLGSFSSPHNRFARSGSTRNETPEANRIPPATSAARSTATAERRGQQAEDLAGRRAGCSAHAAQPRPVAT